jgi:hypothetical protein
LQHRLIQGSRQGVDAPEAIKRLPDDLVGGGLLGDVALDREDVWVLRRLERRQPKVPRG